MLRSLFIASALVAAAAPALAETTVRVNVAGLDDRAVHASLETAARAACRIELRDASVMEQYYLHAGCITSAIARAESQVGATKVAVNAEVRHNGR
jgi:hypothetical protein